MCVTGSHQTRCTGESKKEESPCYDGKFECPKDINYWKNELSEEHRWPLSAENTFSCETTSSFEDTTWSDIVNNDDNNPWMLLSRAFIATKLSLLEGSYSTRAVLEAVNEVEDLIEECDVVNSDSDAQQRAAMLTSFLQLYLSGFIDPKSNDRLEEYLSNNSTGQGALNINQNVGQVLSNGNQGAKPSGTETGSASIEMSFLIVVPTITVILIGVAIFLTIFVVRRRYQKVISTTDFELAELQAQIDKRNQEESGDDVDVDELEELKL